MHKPIATPLNVAVLHGGPSSEHDISVWTSKGVVATLRGEGHTVHAVFVDRNGLWHFGPTGAEAGTEVDRPLPLLEAVGHLRGLGVDVCFLGFHGTFGEDGKVQAVLDLAGVRYTGSGVTASAVAMEKPLARRVYLGVELPVAEAREISTATCRDLEGARVQAAALVADLGLPVVVKVPAGGSSVGVEIPRTEADLAVSLQRLGQDVAHLLCEQFVAGIELTAGVLEGADGELESLPIVEIAPIASDFFDYHAKYQTGATAEIVPARISPQATLLAQEFGRRAHRALGCQGVSRTDMILRDDGRLFLLETNTLPGLTPESLLPKAAASVGYTYADLLHRILAAAVG